jgi:hypothetical protein
MADKNTTRYLPQAILEGGDGCFVRFDSGTITFSELPPLKTQAQEITDRGTVRFGSNSITAAR